MIIVFLLLFCLLLLFIWRHSSHVQVADLSKLRPDARIDSITHDTTGSKAGIDHIRTTITFDDGFSYYTYDTNRDPHFGGETVYVTPRMVERFREEAIAAHEKALAKKAEQDLLYTLSYKDTLKYHWRSFWGGIADSFRRISRHFSNNRFTYLAILCTVVVLATIIIIAIATA